ATVTDATQVNILRVITLFRQNRNGINTRAIMMKLTFEARVFSSVDEVPVPPRAAVVTPMRDSRRIAQNRVQRHLCFIEIAEILGPCIDFFLSRRIPGHLAAEWIRLLLPVLGALSHSGFERSGEVGDLLALEVVEYGHEHVAFHLSEHRIPRRDRKSTRLNSSH